MHAINDCLACRQDREVVTTEPIFVLNCVSTIIQLQKAVPALDDAHPFGSRMTNWTLSAGMVTAPPDHG